MIVAVIPVMNEEGRIGQVIKNLSKENFDRLYIVVNGTTDNTLNEVENYLNSKTKIIYFEECLGIDIPRAVGAFQAYKEGAEGIVFIDGDMIGDLSFVIKELILSIKENKTDMALTNCYPNNHYNNICANYLLEFRAKLNKALKIYNIIGPSTPSHGPHAISRKLLETVPIKEIAIPPVSLAFAAKNNLNIIIAASIPHQSLGSKYKSFYHTKLITETIIGDCIEGILEYKGLKRNRIYKGIEYIGYNSKRRWDLLNDYIKSRT